MAEWLYEDGIGERRAVRVERDRIVEAAIERDGTLRLGAVVAARLAEMLGAGEGRLRLDDGGELVAKGIARGTSIGAALHVEVSREAIPEPGRRKPARGIVTDAAPTPGPSLADRIAAAAGSVRECHPHEPDRFEAAGWSELLEEARSGQVAFAGGALRLSPTPAMTLFDVDGSGPLEPLAIAAAQAVADAIGRHAIGGSIGIDFPTLSGKAARQAVAAAIDRALPPPFERTAVNGFGFLQIVRPRPHASLPELVRADPALTDALAFLRMLEREPPGAPAVHRVPRAVHAVLAARPDWLATLARRTGITHLIECA